MSTFEERKEEYIERLSTNMDFVSHLLKQDDEESRKTAKVLLMPSNEKELRVADGTLTMTEDMKDLVEACACDNVEPIPLEENVGINFLITLIEKLNEQFKANNQADLKAVLAKEMEPLSDPKEIAKMTYGLIVGFTSQSDEVAEYIHSKVNLDFDNEIEMAKFKLYMQEAKAAMHDATPAPAQAPSADMTDEAVDQFEEYVNELHALCKKGIKKDNNISNVFEKLFRELLRGIDTEDE